MIIVPPPIISIINNNNNKNTDSHSQNLYGRIILEKCYIFPELEIVSFKSFPTLNATKIESQTIGYSQEFLFDIGSGYNMTKCSKLAVEKYSSSEFWEHQDQEVVDIYLKNLKVDKNIILDKNKVEYTTEFYWDVDFNYKRKRG